MIDFNEEISRFQPSNEVDRTEEVIYNNDMTDLADILDIVLKSSSEQVSDNRKKA